MPHKIAILGASGYTGAELVRIIATHPSMEIVALSADRKAGQTMAEVYPHLRHLDLPRLVTIDEIDFAGVDLAFCALPHATTQEVVARLPAGSEDRRPLRRLPPARPRGLPEVVRQAPRRARPSGRGRLRPDRILPRRDRGRPPCRRHRLQRRHRPVRLIPLIRAG
jgi:hypothetical protein